jgi:hypothetical protein
MAALEKKDNTRNSAANTGLRTVIIILAENINIPEKI